MTVGRITVTQLDCWNAHSDASSGAVAVTAWDELHIKRRRVWPAIKERPPQWLTMTAEEMLGYARRRAVSVLPTPVLKIISQSMTSVMLCYRHFDRSCTAL
ncbi:MAG: hypothetical protein ACYDEY_11955 [Acidimicrobiales bacterium]